MQFFLFFKIIVIQELFFVKIALLILDFFKNIVYNNFVEPVCRNWQTRQTQNLLSAMACGFESHHRHQILEVFASGIFSIQNLQLIFITIHKLYRNSKRHQYILMPCFIIARMYPLQLQ